MILPTKYVPASDSALGRAAALLPKRASNPTVSELWNTYRLDRPDATFDSFAEALTLLFLVGIVEIEAGILRWQVTT
ncbi:ABC-three component system middle component 6 [Rathayibacter sp. YIM 133350]|uniref:ABC-three component system middle component 6 n=1 Tax=Rathayibacter sp. YIM 133350 TaxID=3131992 RepID=UPI003FD3E3B4